MTDVEQPEDTSSTPEEPAAPDTPPGMDGDGPPPAGSRSWYWIKTVGVMALILGAVKVGLDKYYKPADGQGSRQRQQVMAIVKKMEKGQKLTPEERELMKRVRKAYIRAKKKKQRGEKLTEREQRILADASKARKILGNKALRGKGRKPAGGQKGRKSSNRTTRISLGLTPIMELKDAPYKGLSGGLYDKDSNEPPKELVAAVGKATDRIVPLDAQGKPDAQGKIGLIASGTTEAQLGFAAFKQMAEFDARKNPALLIVDGYAMTAEQTRISTPSLFQRLADAGVTPPQVQVAWINHALPNPDHIGPFPRHVDSLATALTDMVGGLRKRFPNLRICYLSSPIYSEFGTTKVLPEPYAYEAGFAVRKAILAQIPGLEKAGDVPVLVWGPYLWADGKTPRKTDGLFWDRSDFSTQGGLPSPTGCTKMGQLLLKFFSNDAMTKRWFVKKSSD